MSFLLLTFFYYVIYCFLLWRIWSVARRFSKTTHRHARSLMLCATSGRTMRLRRKSPSIGARQRATPEAGAVALTRPRTRSWRGTANGSRNAKGAGSNGTRMSPQARRSRRAGSATKTTHTIASQWLSPTGQRRCVSYWFATTYHLFGLFAFNLSNLWSNGRGGRNRTDDKGFAIPCLTTWLLRE